MKELCGQSDVTLISASERFMSLQNSPKPDSNVHNINVSEFDTNIYVTSRKLFSIDYANFLGIIPRIATNFLNDQNRVQTCILEGPTTACVAQQSKRW